MGNREAATEQEHDALLFFLNRVRDAVVRKCDGPSDDLLRAHGVPSGTSLLGLVHHLTAMEIHWFRRVFAGEHIDVDESMNVPRDVTHDDVISRYRAACADSDRIVRSTRDLSTLATGSNPGEAQRASLRRIVVHMVEETARHAGHADILRERLDGTTGD